MEDRSLQHLYVKICVCDTVACDKVACDKVVCERCCVTKMLCERWCLKDGV